MASLVLSGDTSGSITVSAPAVAGSNTQTLVAATDTLAPIIRGTAVTCAGQTSIDFTSIPPWVKRITVMFNGVSTSGTSAIIVQIGAGSFTTSNYVSGTSGAYSGNVVTGATFTAGFSIQNSNLAANTNYATVTIANISGNTWYYTSVLSGLPSQNGIFNGGGSITLGGTLDRVRITTVGGTDTFDTTPSPAGSINILYE